MIIKYIYMDLFLLIIFASIYMDTENNFKLYLNDLIQDNDNDNNYDYIQNDDNCLPERFSFWNQQRREYIINQQNTKSVVCAELNEINVKVSL